MHTQDTCPLFDVTSPPKTLISRAFVQNRTRALCGRSASARLKNECLPGIFTPHAVVVSYSALFRCTSPQFRRNHLPLPVSSNSNCSRFRRHCAHDNMTLPIQCFITDVQSATKMHRVTRIASHFGLTRMGSSCVANLGFLAEESS